MSKYKLKINYHNNYGNFKKDTILNQIGPYFETKNKKLILHEDFVCSNLDIFELITPLFYTKDYAEGVFPLVSDIMKGEPIYEKMGSYLIGLSPGGLTVFLFGNWTGKEKYDKKKYFSNKQNAQNYYNSLQKIEFEVGKWYKLKHGNIYLIYQRLLNNNGFVNNFWQTNIHIGPQDHFEVADIKEVESLLLNEAKKRFPTGTKFYNRSNVKSKITKDIYYFIPNINSIQNNGNYILYKGKWIETIKEPKKWEVGTYIVMIDNEYQVTKKIIKNGDISKIHAIENTIYLHTDFGVPFSINSLFAQDDIKWFATEDEAEEFAKTLKPKLMLGEIKVTINSITKSISTRSGTVTFRQWINWIDRLDGFKILKEIKEFELELNEYKTVLHPNSDADNSIGCIHNVSWKQIDDITNAIKNLKL